MENQSPDPSTTPGMFSWNELMTADVDASAAFYGRLFGWTYDDMPMPSGCYKVIRQGPAYVGGILPRPEGCTGPTMWGSYVTVENPDTTCEEATKLGAKVLMPPTDFPDVGRFAMVLDPQGAVIGFGKYFR